MAKLNKKITKNVKLKQEQDLIHEPNATDKFKCGEAFCNSKGILTFVCFRCGQEFDVANVFTKHIMSHFHEFGVSVVKIENEISIHSNVTQSEKTTAENIVDNCSVLIKKETCNTRYYDDLMSENNNPVSISNGKLQVSSKETTTYKCDVCQKHYSSKHHIKQHMNIHTNAEKTHKCHICGWQFRDKGNLNRHITTHMNKKTFSCGVCGKQFAQVRYLTDHRKIHSGEKFLCAICGVSFLTSKSFSRHMAQHTGVKKFICHICNRSFFRSDTLKEHKRVHTGERRFNCLFCHKSYSVRKSLTFHEQNKHK